MASRSAYERGVDSVAIQQLLGHWTVSVTTGRARQRVRVDWLWLRTAVLGGHEHQVLGGRALMGVLEML